MGNDINLPPSDVNMRKITSLGHRLADIVWHISSEVDQEKIVHNLKSLLSKAEEIRALESEGT